MALTVLTDSYTQADSNNGTALKAVMAKFVSLGALTFIEATIDTATQYVAYYRMSGINSGLKLLVYNGSSSTTTSSLTRAYFKILTDDGVQSITTNYMTMLTSGYVTQLKYYSCANNKFHVLFWKYSSSAFHYVFWCNADTFNSSSTKAIASVTNFGSSSSTFLLSEDGTKPYINDFSALNNLEGAWGAGTAVAVPVFIYDGLIPWKGINSSYIYYSSIYPTEKLSVFNIGDTEFLYLGDKRCIKT